ncbi:MAG: phage tail protein, partial [Actinobacteria bacterium]|nr:phage tail protein [Actinomycetota bacterium]
GTRAGLHQFLEMTSGGEAEVVDGGGIWPEGEAPADTAHVTMKVASTGWLEEADFVALVRDEVPAHVRAELWIGDRRVWSSAVEAGP